jgi:hypothetical protein
MIDSYDVIKAIEKIHKETSLLEGIKNKNTKQNIILIILPNVIWIISSFTIAVFTFMSKYSIFYIVLSIICFMSMIWLHYGYKYYIKLQYGVFLKDDEISFHNRFRENLLKNDFSKEVLVNIKNILEIETREETNYLSIYFFGFFSLVLVPITLITFEEFIRNDLRVLSYTIIFAVFAPPIMYFIKIFMNRKNENKKRILKKIERIILEI